MDKGDVCVCVCVCVVTAYKCQRWGWQGPRRGRGGEALKQWSDQFLLHLLENVEDVLYFWKHSMVLDIGECLTILDEFLGAGEADWGVVEAAGGGRGGRSHAPERHSPSGLPQGLHADPRLQDQPAEHPGGFRGEHDPRERRALPMAQQRD